MAGATSESGRAEPVRSTGPGPRSGDQPALRRVGFLDRPPGVAFHLALAVPLVVLLVAGSVPAGDFGIAVLGVLALMVAGVTWLLRGIAYVDARRRGRAQGDPRWFLVGPAVAALTAVVAAVELPLQARWALSRNAFEDALQETPVEADGRIGLYDVSSVRAHGDATVFHVAASGFMFESGGFAHIPDPAAERPDLAERTDYHHLSGDWYWFTSTW
jgi:hypothetical protein